MTAPPTESSAAGALAGGAAVAALVDVESAALERVRVTLLLALARLWTAFGGFYDDAAVAEFGRQAARLVVAAQRSTGMVVERHLRMQLAGLGVEPAADRVVDLPESLRIGAMTEDVYQRPARTVRYVASLDPDAATVTPEAVDRGGLRLEKLADTDLQLAKTTAAQQVLYAAPQVTGYRRVIHPEVSEQVCGLCIVASDRIYSREELLPLHPGCHCTVLPIAAGRDPGRAVNAEDLQRIYTAAGSTRAEVLRRTRVRVSQHGELGPILSPAGQAAPRDRRDVQRANSRPTEEQRRRSLETQRDTLRAQLQRGGLATGQSAWLADRLEQVEQQLLAA